jgi:hypothetical protein
MKLPLYIIKISMAVLMTISALMLVVGFIIFDIELLKLSLAVFFGTLIIGTLCAIIYINLFEKPTE